MLLKKNVQVHTEIPETDSTGLEVTQAVSVTQLKQKGMATLGALFLLIAVVVIGTVAWFTRVSNVTGMTMDVAEYDFNANYAEESFIVSVGDYLTSDEGKAAPGTSGIIPIRMSAGDSETAVTYSLALDFSEMADEFQKRIRFYYYTKNGETYTLHTIEPWNSTETENQIKGTLPAHKVKYEYIYWEWVYELDDEWFGSDGRWYHKGASATDVYTYGTDTNVTGQTIFNSIYGETLATDTDLFDEFDTAIGLGERNQSIECHYDGNARTETAEDDADGTADKLFAYQKAMKVKLHVTGAQAKPVPATATTTNLDATEVGTAVYKPIS